MFRAKLEVSVTGDTVNIDLRGEVLVRGIFPWSDIKRLMDGQTYGITDGWVSIDADDIGRGYRVVSKAPREYEAIVSRSDFFDLVTAA